MFQHCALSSEIGIDNPTMGIVSRDFAFRGDAGQSVSIRDMDLAGRRAFQHTDRCWMRLPVRIFVP